MANDGFVPPLAPNMPPIVGYDGTDLHLIRTSTSGKLQATIGITDSQATTGTVSAIIATSSAAQTIAANANRKGLIIHNGSSVAGFFGLSTVAASTTLYSILVASSGEYTLPGPFIYTGQVNGIFSGTSTSAVVNLTELT